MKVFGPLKTITTVMSDSKSPTLSMIHPLKEQMLRGLQADESDSPLIRDVKAAVVKDLKPSVYAFPVPEGKSGQQVVDQLQKQVELLGAMKTGNFYVDCETYQSNFQIGATQRLIHVLHSSEQPASCFSVLDTGTTLIADVLFEVLIAKLTTTKSGKDSFYQQRKGFKMEAKGPRYELSDFVIKIGSVSMASNFKGILVEVEYCPCCVPMECWNLMRELMQGFLGNVAETPPAQVKNKMDTFYSPGDTINQYLEHFNTFRKQTTVNQPIR